MKIVGMTRCTARSLGIPDAVYGEMEKLARAATQSRRWTTKELAIVETYGDKVPTTTLLEMLKLLRPDLEWSLAMVYSRVRRMGLGGKDKSDLSAEDMDRLARLEEEVAREDRELEEDEEGEESAE